MILARRRVPRTSSALKKLAPSLLTAACFWCVACGMPGSPQPPSLHLPEPVTDLAASRTGDTVHLSWTMPRRTTDRILLVGLIDVHVCRKIESEPCVSVADTRHGPDQAAEYDDPLPADLRSGAPRLLTYQLELRNHAGRAAGPSNAAFTAAGIALAPLAGFVAQPRPDGVALQWEPVPSSGNQPFVRLHRALQTKPGEPPAPKSAVLSASPGISSEQVLEVDPRDGKHANEALDRDASFNQKYVYTAQRVTTLTIMGHTVEVRGVPSDAIAVDTRDVFPPHPPTGLVAVADAGEGAIDLSWTPNNEPDFAGYAIYRQESGSGSSPQRLSPATPVLLAPAYRDSTAVPGHSYRYSVTAYDRDGNQSAPSNAAQESLPAPQ